MKSISVLFFCILAAALTLGATTAPRPATASQTTFESPLPPWCEDNGNQQPCLPWRPTPMSLSTSAPMRQSGQCQSLAQLGWMVSIAILLVGIGVALVAIRGRSMVRVNLVALLEQVGPYVLGGDERVRLISIIRNIAPDQTVTIDLSRCAEK